MDSKKVKKIEAAKLLLMDAVLVLDNIPDEGYLYDGMLSEVIGTIETLRIKLSKTIKMPDE